MAAPASKVIAFEPFAGNMPLLKKNTDDLPNVTIIPKAVAAERGHAPFFVASVAGNSNQPGYSAVGELIDRNNPKAEQAVQVEVCRLDDEIQEHVRFLKMDVQGGEYNVLRGANALLTHYGIDIIVTEFSGDQRILTMILDAGYTVFDTGFVTGPRNPDDGPPPGWTKFKKLTLSTGAPGYQSEPDEYPRSPGNYCAYLRDHRAKYGWIQTDLFCVKHSFMRDVLKAAAEA
jgi:FkbM family methyltransferase